MKFDRHPLHTPMIRSADEVLRIDLTEHTQEVLRRRAEQVHPTMNTTAGRPEWRVGRSVDPPGSSSAPMVFSPTMLERAPAEQPTHPSIADVVARLGR